MDKKLGGLMILFFLLVTIFTSFVLFNKQLSTITRAKEDYVPSAKASLLFAYPLLVKADGVDKSLISVFIRSDKGMPVKSQKVTITTTSGQLSATDLTTDDTGKASLSITSTTPGIANIGAIIGDSLKMTQPLSITFQ